MFIAILNSLLYLWHFLSTQSIVNHLESSSSLPIVKYFVKMFNKSFDLLMLQLVCYMSLVIYPGLYEWIDRKLYLNVTVMYVCSGLATW